jgi:hypothetical protein
MFASDDHVRIFCDTCQRNQTLFTNLLAEYLPDENDPAYSKYLDSYEDYKIELEDRYPQVCSDCLPRVQAQIRNANHVARADNLARIMEASKERRSTVQTSRQAWLLSIISLAKWTYILSTATGLLWHAAGLIMAPDQGSWADKTFSWDICIDQAFYVRSVDESCVLSPYIVNLMYYAIAADALTMWWNPKLKDKTNSLTGRMRRLTLLWAIRIVVVILRLASVHHLKQVTIDYDTLKSFQYTHLAMLAILTLSSFLTWKTVSIVYGTAPTFSKASKEPVPSVPDSATKRERQNAYRPAHPQADVFDDMAQSFTSGFRDQQASSPLPPSPTESNASFTSYATDATTPYAKRTTFMADDDMDWTPTRNRFSSNPPEILTNQFRAVQTHPSPPPEPHSIFSKPDPNPFRHKVPAAPRSSAQQKVNPWKSSVWSPPLKVNAPNFFKEEQKAGDGESKGLDGLGVPKTVKRDAELFASPKLKYDYYGTMKDTGLEDTFNGLFSKF